MSKFCQNCGAATAQGATFCVGCGRSVSGEVTSENAHRRSRHARVAGAGGVAFARPAAVRQPAMQQTPAAPPAGPARRNNKYIGWALGAAAVLTLCVLGVAAIAWLAGGTGMGLPVGLALAVLPVPFYLALTLWIDRYEKEPTWLLAGAFLWGATFAVFFSGIINTIGGTVVTVFAGDGAGSFFGSVISAPIVEESTKALALFILFFWKRDEFDNVIDGIVYATMIGLGFTLVEDLIYHARAFAEAGLGGSIGSFISRGLLSPWGHPIYTSMTGIGLGLAVQSSSRLVKFGAPAAGLTTAIVLHAIWNGTGYVLSGLPALVFQFLVFYPSLVAAVLAVVFFALRREGSVVRRYLTPELQGGLITRQEYEALGSVRGRLRSTFQALKNGGYGGWRAYSRFAQTATELAFYRDRVRRGITSVDAASREDAYVRILQSIRAQQVA